jgi:hypothetical protein
VTRTRSISVGFYVASHYGPEPWPTAVYPADLALDAIAHTSTEKRRVKTVSSLYGERVANVFFEKPDRRLLSIENVELGAQVRESRRGRLRNRQYGPDEGPAFQTYLMFLEANVVGLVRLDRGPFPKQVCTVIEVLTGYGLDLSPLLDPDIARRVSTHKSDEVTRMKFSALRGRAERIRQTTSLGKVFEAAESVFPHGEEFTFSVSVREARDRQRFWGESKVGVVDKLVRDEDALDQFEEAEIGLTHGKPIDLLEHLFLWKGSVPADESRHVDEKIIALAIQEAYVQERGAILEAIGQP